MRVFSVEENRKRRDSRGNRRATRLRKPTSTRGTWTRSVNSATTSFTTVDGRGRHRPSIPETRARTDARRRLARFTSSRANATTRPPLDARPPPRTLDSRESPHSFHFISFHVVRSFVRVAVASPLGPRAAPARSSSNPPARTPSPREGSSRHSRARANARTPARRFSDEPWCVRNARARSFARDARSAPRARALGVNARADLDPSRRPAARDRRLTRDARRALSRRLPLIA